MNTAVVRLLAEAGLAEPDRVAEAIFARGEPA